MLPHGAFPCGVSGLPHIPPVPIPQEGSSGGVGIEMEQQIHPCLWIPLGDGLSLARGSPGLFHTHLGPSWCSELHLCCGSGVWCSGAARSKPGFGKLTLVAAGGRGTAGRDGCPALSQKPPGFVFFLRIFPVFPHPNPQKTFLTSVPHWVNWVIVNY